MPGTSVFGGNMGFEVVKTVTSTESLTLDDAGSRIVVNSASLVELTLPSVDADNVGTIFNISTINSGNVKVIANDSDTIVDSAAGGYIIDQSGWSYRTISIVLASATGWTFRNYPLGQWETDG